MAGVPKKMNLIIDRLMWLKCHPTASCKQYCDKFECSRRTYYRDKEFVELYLWNYKVELIN